MVIKAGIAKDLFTLLPILHYILTDNIANCEISKSIKQF